MNTKNIPALLLIIIYLCLHDELKITVALIFPCLHFLRDLLKYQVKMTISEIWNFCHFWTTSCRIYMNIKFFFSLILYTAIFVLYIIHVECLEILIIFTPCNIKLAIFSPWNSAYFDQIWKETVTIATKIVNKILMLNNVILYEYLSPEKVSWKSKMVRAATL